MSVNQVKQLSLYVVGLFSLSLGVSFSIQANLGVSPVSSLPYALTLSTEATIAITTIVVNILFIFVQMVLHRKSTLKDYLMQIPIVLLFGFFMYFTLEVLQLFATPIDLLARMSYLVVSLFLVATGLLLYFAANLPLMPYDALTYVIGKRFGMKLSKAKILTDSVNVVIASAVCLMFTRSLGAIGFGTLISVYFIGKILGWLIKLYQKPLRAWYV